MGSFFFRSRSDVFNFTAHLDFSQLTYAWLNTDSIVIDVVRVSIQRFEIYEFENIKKKKTIYKLSRMTSGDVLERDVYTIHVFI